EAGLLGRLELDRAAPVGLERGALVTAEGRRGSAGRLLLLLRGFGLRLCSLARLLRLAARGFAGSFGDGASARSGGGGSGVVLVVSHGVRMPMRGSGRSQIP